MTAPPSIAQVWNRIDAWLAANAPETAAGLRPPATDEAIARAERDMYLHRLPEPFRESLAIHDGGIGILDCVELLPIRDVVAAWRTAVAVARSGDHEEAVTVGPTRPCIYHRAWIPITGESRDALVLDLDPPGGGAVGQIVTASSHDLEREVVASGFLELLSSWAAELEAGCFSEQDGVLVRVSGSDRKSYERVALDVTRVASDQAARGISSATFVDALATGDGCDLVPGAEVLGSIKSWDARGIELEHGETRIHVSALEISWKGNVFVPDPKIGRVGDEIRIKVLDYDPVDKVWCGSVRQLTPEDDPLREPDLFRRGTRHRAEVAFVEPCRVVFDLQPRGVRAEMSRRIGDHHELRSGSVVEVEVTSFSAKYRSISVEIVGTPDRPDD